MERGSAVLGGVHRRSRPAPWRFTRDLLSKLQFSRPGLGAVALGLVFIAVCVLWTLVDHRVPDGDQGRHLFTVGYFVDQLKLGHQLVPFRYEPPSGAIYPPLVYGVGMLGMLVGGKNPDAPVLALDVVFIALLALGVYRAGRIAYGPLAGMLAVGFGLASPMLISQSHLFMFDMPLTAMVAVAVWLLLASHRFADLRVCVAAGVVVGLGLLTKPPFAFFVIPPVLVMLLRGGWRNWRGVLIVAGLGALIAAPWYLRHRDKLGGVATEATAEVPNQFGSNSPRFSVENFAWYGWNLVNQQLFLPLVLFFLAGSFAAARRFLRERRPDDHTPELLAGAFGSILIVALWFGYQDARYTLPATVFIAALGSGWLVWLRPRLRGMAIAVLAGVVALNVFAVNTGSPGELTLKLPGGKPKSVAEEHELTLIRSFGYVVGKPERWGDVLGVMRGAHRDGFTHFTFEPVSPISLNPSGIVFFASTLKAEAVPSGTEHRPHTLLIAARPVAPGMPPPCVRLAAPYGLYLFRGDPPGADPSRERRRLYCPR
jgi:hypothetical protein